VTLHKAINNLLPFSLYLLGAPSAAHCLRHHLQFSLEFLLVEGVGVHRCKRLVAWPPVDVWDVPVH